jgi:hypothetical protein
MAEKPYAADDSLEPTAVTLPADQEAVAFMGRCFVEEFARLGYRRNALMALFRTPFYQGPHMVYRQLGEGFVSGLIDEEMTRRAARTRSGVTGG